MDDPPIIGDMIEPTNQVMIGYDTILKAYFKSHSTS